MVLQPESDSENENQQEWIQNKGNRMLGYWQNYIKCIMAILNLDNDLIH